MAASRLTPPLGAGQDLPSGIITFLFTDIEGSTRLVQQLGDDYAGLHAEQEQIMRAAWAEHNGTVVGTQGDSFFVAFPHAADAVRAVVQAQRALGSHPWAQGVSVRVRMGLHTGEPQISAQGYMGIDIHRAARISAVAYGGQVLLSQATVDAVESELPEGVTLRDLGAHRLKDLRQPKHLYQLVIQDLPSEFPPLRSLSLAPNNLPVQLTSFVGRAAEIGELRQLLAGNRLVTLTGPGGSGKTRLALEVAAEIIERFTDGVFFVPLAPITDPGLIASAVAQAVGFPETPGRPLGDGLKDHLRSRALLLVLDNFEQIVSAAAFVAELLEACRDLKILITSREALRIGGERTYPVPPLHLPDLSKLLTLESLSEFASVQLFVQRAQAVRPDFRMTTATAPAIAEICFRLDGLPLAIELAAARIKLLAPQAILARLDDRLEFLTGGGRDLPSRQQTLRDAIAWSYDLLDEAEQKLFQRLSVFIGGCTVESVEAVAGDEAGRSLLLDGLGSLVDKSLLRQAEGMEAEPRFTMLELLREFGLQQLDASAEQGQIRRRHAEYFLALAERTGDMPESEEQIRWMNHMEEEHDNLRAALEWCSTAEDAAELCVRLATSLGYFWEARGYLSEGRERLSALLSSRVGAGPTAARAGLLARAAELAYRQSDYPATLTFARESLAICRALGDRHGAAAALIKLANAATEGGDYTTAAGYLKEALKIWRGLNDRRGTARVLISLGWNALRSGDHRAANVRLEEALEISREVGDARSMGFELSGLGEVALRQGDYARAEQLMGESLELRRQLGHKWGVGVSLGMLGWVAMRQRDWDAASARLVESLRIRHEIGDKGGCAWCLERLAGIALARGQVERAIRLFGGAAALRASIGSAIDPVDRSRYQKNIRSLRTRLGRDRFKEIWKEGGAMTREQTIAYALEPSEVPPPPD